MQTIELNIPEKISAILNKISLDNNQIKQNIILQLLEEYIQDISDYENAIKILDSNEKSYSLEEIKKEHGLEN
jgi:predicted DNA-binding protein